MPKKPKRKKVKAKKAKKKIAKAKAKAKKKKKPAVKPADSSGVAVGGPTPPTDLAATIEDEQKTP